MIRPAGRAATAFATVLAGVALVLAGCSSAADEPVETPEETMETGDGLTGNLTVFAAASLTAAFDTLTADFAAEHPRVTFESITYDGSSTLATQLVEGATADVFASADEANMQVAADADLLASDARIFATNSLVIAVAPGNPLGIETLADLTAVPAAVVCAPEVPCGAAGVRLFDAAGVALEPASEEQNVTAVLTKVRMGEADAGLVYLTDVLSAEGEVEGIEIDGAAQDANRYPIALLSGSENAEAARAFIDYVLSPAGAAVLEGIGFGAA